MSRKILNNKKSIQEAARDLDFFDRLHCEELDREAEAARNK